MTKNIRLRIKGPAGFEVYHPETNFNQVLNTSGESLEQVLVDASTTKKGLVQLTNSTNSTSTTTAATPSSVKSAYDLADSKALKTVATTSSDGLLSKGDKSKLDGVAAGANNYTHPVNHPASMITGLSSVATSGNYNDLSNKPTIGTAGALNTGTSLGNIPVLGSDGKLDASIVPAIAITDTFISNSQTEMLALDVQVGDVCVRTDLSKTFILRATPASTLSSWQDLLTPTSDVTSVAGKTGAVVLTKADVGLSNVANESKATMFTSPVLTGTPMAPTASAATNTTQVATTAFVKTDTAAILANAKAYTDTQVADKVDKMPGKQLSTEDFTTTEKTKLNGIATGAQVNQNAFSNFKVGSTTVVADNVTDTLELVAGTNVVLTPDATNDKITIALGVGVETTTGAQAKVSQAVVDIKEYTDTKISISSKSSEGMNWKNRMGAL